MISHCSHLTQFLLMLWFQCLSFAFHISSPLSSVVRANAVCTNVGHLLERRGKEFLGSSYKDPITSFSDFQKFSVLNPEVHHTKSKFCFCFLIFLLISSFCHHCTLFQVYWRTVLDELDVSFSVPPKRILQEISSGESQSTHPGDRWLPDASINPAKNCLTVNSRRSLSATVIIWREELHDDQPLHKMTLKELREEVWYAGISFKTHIII